MPPIERPPVSPQIQAQMGAPGPGFGPGIGMAQQQMEKSPAQVAVSTVEKILMGVPNDTFRKYAMEAIARLKVGAAMADKEQPMSQPPQMGQGGQPSLPPMPGQMPG